MKHLTLAMALAAFTGLPAMADTKAFRDIIGDAANIQMDAEALRDRLKNTVVDQAAFKQDVAALSRHIESLRLDVEALDSQLQGLTPQQQKDWEAAKTKVQVMQIFSDWKQVQVESGDINKNRSMLRAHAEGIAQRASMLQRTIHRLDR